MPTIERLVAGDGARWRSIRLSALAEAPHSFRTTLAEAASWPAERWEMQVVQLATFVAVVDGRDVGVARGAVHERADVRELLSVWVDPGFRGQRITAQLIDAVAGWAKNAGATVLLLNVFDQNVAAISAYERAGFVRCDGEEMGAPIAGQLCFMRSL